jgi:hypothetical protein
MWHFFMVVRFWCPSPLLYRLPIVRLAPALERTPVAVTLLKMHTGNFAHAQLFYAAIVMASCACLVLLVLARTAKTGPALL